MAVGVSAHWIDSEHKNLDVLEILVGRVGQEHLVRPCYLSHPAVRECQGNQPRRVDRLFQVIQVFHAAQRARVFLGNLVAHHSALFRHLLVDLVYLSRQEPHELPLGQEAQLGQEFLLFHSYQSFQLVPVVPFSRDDPVDPVAPSGTSGMELQPSS